ncbi:MAG: hypothetical protein H0V21_06070 [Rubrobacter sp.]|nr:hypothetical protein [Rubrobacter sp.]
MSERSTPHPTRNGVLYWMVFTTIYSINWEDDREDRFLIEFEDDEAARSWEIPGGMPLGTDVPSLRALEPVPAGWMEKWGRGQRVYSPDELLDEVRRRWSRGDG